MPLTAGHLEQVLSLLCASIYPSVKWTVGLDHWFLNCWGMAFPELGILEFPGQHGGRAKGG